MSSRLSGDRAGHLSRFMSTASNRSPVLAWLPAAAALAAALVGLDQHRLGADAEHPLARPPAAASEPVQEMRLFHALALPGRRRAGARRAVPAQAPPARVAGRDRADARARRCSTCSRGSTSRRRAITWGVAAACWPAQRVQGPSRPDHAALGRVAGPAARAAGLAVGGVATWARRGVHRSLGDARDRVTCWRGSRARSTTSATRCSTTISRGSHWPSTWSSSRRCWRSRT